MIFSWFLSGLLAGLALITRTNGIALIGLLLFPITSKSTNVTKFKAVTLLMGGLLIPIIMWISFAIFSGSPIFPTDNYRNLALTYFSGSSDRISVDANLKASEGLMNTWQVLAKDPAHMAKTYIHDLVSNSFRLFSSWNLLPFPYLQLAWLGLFVLIFKKFDTFNRVLLFNLLVMFLLLNFKAWENRYYLYLLPFMGAGIAALLTHIFSRLKKLSQNAVIFLFVLFLTSSYVFGMRTVKRTLDSHLSNLSLDAIEASKFLKDSAIPKNTIIIARKPHLGFYTGLNSKLFPDAESMEGLKLALKEIASNQSNDGKIYLFYGSAEKILRPKLADLGSLDLKVPWLRRASWGKEVGGWILYEVLCNKF